MADGKRSGKGKSRVAPDTRPARKFLGPDVASWCERHGIDLLHGAAIGHAAYLAVTGRPYAPGCHSTAAEIERFRAVFMHVLRRVAAGGLDDTRRIRFRLIREAMEVLDAARESATSHETVPAPSDPAEVPAEAEGRPARLGKAPGRKPTLRMGRPTSFRRRTYTPALRDRSRYYNALHDRETGGARVIHVDKPDTGSEADR
jgi:hypothetical protein